MTPLLPLVLGNPQELHRPPLIGRESGDLTNQIADQLVAVGVAPLGGRGLGPHGVGGGLVALVEADADLVTGSHGAGRLKWG